MDRSIEKVTILKVNLLISPLVKIHQNHYYLMMNLIMYSKNENTLLNEFNNVQYQILFLV